MPLTLVNCARWLVVGLCHWVMPLSNFNCVPLGCTTGLYYLTVPLSIAVTLGCILSLDYVSGLCLVRCHMAVCISSCGPCHWPVPLGCCDILGCYANTAEYKISLATQSKTKTKTEETVSTMKRKLTYPFPPSLPPSIPLVLLNTA